MRHLLASCLTLGVMLSTTSGAFANTEALERLATQAQSVRREAEDMRRLLKDRKTDLNVVAERVRLLESQAQALKDAVAAASPIELSPGAAQSWQRARAASDSMLGLLTSKAQILANPDKAQRERGLLRAKASGIAKRAAMVEQHVARLRG